MRFLVEYLSGKPSPKKEYMSLSPYAQCNGFDVLYEKISRHYNAKVNSSEIMRAEVLRLCLDVLDGKKTLNELEKNLDETKKNLKPTGYLRSESDTQKYAKEVIQFVQAAIKRKRDLGLEEPLLTSKNPAPF